MTNTQSVYTTMHTLSSHPIIVNRLEGHDFDALSVDRQIVYLHQPVPKTERERETVSAEETE
jgi:hypothetical protein